MASRKRLENAVALANKFKGLNVFYESLLYVHENGILTKTIKLNSTDYLVKFMLQIEGTDEFETEYKLYSQKPDGNWYILN